MFKLIMEQAFTSTDVQIIEENMLPGQEKKIIFKTVLQTANTVNNNKRIYPTETLMEVVRQLKPKANSRKLLGELDHPQPQGDSAAKLKRSSTILLQNVCVLFRTMDFVDGKIVAECETLSTPSGMTLYALLKDNATIGFSLRAFGETADRGGVQEVKAQGIKALTFDVVANPSHDDAVIVEFLQEGENPQEIIGNLLQEMHEYKCGLGNSKNKQLMEESSSLFNDIRKNYKAEVKESGMIKESCINGICMKAPIEETIDFLMEQSFNNKKINQVKVLF